MVGGVPHDARALFDFARAVETWRDRHRRQFLVAMRTNLLPALGNLALQGRHEALTIEWASAP